MSLNKNQFVTAMETCSNVATSNPKEDMNTNPTVATNTTGGNVGDKSSSWGIPWSSSNANLQNQRNRTSHSILH